MRASVALGLWLLSGCPQGSQEAYCPEEDEVDLVGDEMIDDWGMALDDLPVLAGSPLAMTLRYDEDDGTVPATLALSQENAVLHPLGQGADSGCEARVLLDLTVMIQSDDGAFNEVFEANKTLSGGTLGGTEKAFYTDQFGGTYLDDFQGRFQQLELYLYFEDDSQFPTTGLTLHADDTETHIASLEGP